MKKLFSFAVLAIALMAFGIGVGTNTVHAQTTSSQNTATNTASLQQQLDVAKATLINLEMQEGIIPQGDNQIGTGATQSGATVTPTATQTGAQTVSANGTSQISASEAQSFTSMLGQLTTMLSELNAEIQANPNMSQSQISSFAMTLRDMQNTIALIATQITQAEQGGSATTNPATSAPSTSAAPSSASTGSASANAAPAGATAGNGTAQTTAPTPATSSANTGAAAAAATGSAAQTAQVSSFWSFTKSNWPVLVIIVLVIAILAILFWPDNEAKAPTIERGSAPSGASKTPSSSSDQANATSSSASTPPASKEESAPTDVRNEGQAIDPNAKKTV